MATEISENRESRRIGRKDTQEAQKSENSDDTGDITPTNVSIARDAGRGRFPCSPFGTLLDP